MAVEAVRKAILDAGLRASDIDGMMSYQNGDSTPANWVAPDLGIRLNFYMDVLGGGSSTEALIGLAMGAIEVGMCRTVAIFRSMNGYTEFRIGGTGARAAQPALIDGEVGVVVAPRGKLPMVLKFTVAGGKIAAMEAIGDRDRLRQLDLAVL